MRRRYVVAKHGTLSLSFSVNMHRRPSQSRWNRRHEASEVSSQLLTVFQRVFNILASAQIVKAAAAGNRVVRKVHFSTTLADNRSVTLVVVTRNEFRSCLVRSLRQMTKLVYLSNGHSYCAYGVARSRFKRAIFQRTLNRPTMAHIIEPRRPTTAASRQGTFRPTTELPMSFCASHGSLFPRLFDR